MNMQQMIMQAQKLQKQMQKAEAELDEKEFSNTNGGGVTVKMLGNHEIISIDIDADLLEADSKDMLQDMIKVCINDLLKQIDEAHAAIQSSATNGISF